MTLTLAQLCMKRRDSMIPRKQKTKKGDIRSVGRMSQIENTGFDLWVMNPWVRDTTPDEIARDLPQRHRADVCSHTTPCVIRRVSYRSILGVSRVYAVVTS